MCIACEMNFWSMLDALPPEARERILRAQLETERLACEAPPAQTAPAPPPSEDERKS